MISVCIYVCNTREIEAQILSKCILLELNVLMVLVHILIVVGHEAEGVNVFEKLFVGTPLVLEPLLLLMYLAVLDHDEILQVGHEAAFGFLILRCGLLLLVLVGFAHSSSVAFVFVADHFAPPHHVRILLLDSILLLDYYRLCNMVRVVIGTLGLLLEGQLLLRSYRCLRQRSLT